MTTPSTRRARTAVFTVFASNGAIFAALASRIPDIKGALGLTPGALGTVLLVGMLGSVVGLPLAGVLTGRYGPARTLRTAAALQLVSYGFAAAILAFWPSPTAFAAGLFAGSIGMGIWDVSMNLEGAAVERRSGRTIMPWFHAAFSGGTVVSALVGAAASALGVPSALHFLTVACVGVALAAWATGRFLLFEPARVRDSESSVPTSGRSPWTEPRTLLIGVMVLVAAFTEGTANDWVAVALQEGYHLPSWAGVLGFAVFLAAMTTGRVLGAGLLDRFGRVTVLRVLFVAAAVGSLLVVFGGPWLAFVGASIWGLGASLGFPVGMSAAADDPERAAARVSVVSTIGYVAFLVGPPGLGFVGDHVGVLRALAVVGAASLLAFLVAPAARPEKTGLADSPEEASGEGGSPSPVAAPTT